MKLLRKNLLLLLSISILLSLSACVKKDTPTDSGEQTKVDDTVVNDDRDESNQHLKQRKIMT